METSQEMILITRSSACIDQMENTMERSQQMKSSLITLTVDQDGPLRFIARTSSGLAIIAEPGPLLGGSGTEPNPLEYFISSLGSCAAIKLQIELTRMGQSPGSIAIQLECTRSTSMPDILNTIHLVFSVTGTVDGNLVRDAIHEVMTFSCPVAVMVSRVVQVTWECR